MFYGCEGEGCFGFGEIGNWLEGENGIAGYGFGVGYGVDAFDDEKSLVGEYEAILFFG